jgi:hypothetical protein
MDGKAGGALKMRSIRLCPANVEAPPNALQNIRAPKIWTTRTQCWNKNSEVALAGEQQKEEDEDQDNEHELNAAPDEADQSLDERNQVFHLSCP